ncbi:DUF7352 domain-containing protein [Riemerella anatipestifer]|uniref:DUF7352 domain-containing protein n=1 Tax=Riemerella anatipestifer TaxID=34085 RepID=A0A1S7DU47_RIEAN|nr:hypothetical protein [Riemerella anatipestifer]AQY22662.1 hypothetical protein AB406_1719 [Riemerella anatipestifer]MCO4304731.1 hypothetical protein [Riemerella anatipestifer]MCQ4038880.1 hypothetical protein [Riemerella anatipestifer]MCT6761684.1 hypothetical protein [Riemerella anatipestifer]MCT6764342.1 hypothetical protein [Riemerella anatipestifer]
MKNRDLIEKLKQLPPDVEVKIFDWRKNLGDGSSEGIYDFDVELHKFSELEKEHIIEHRGHEPKDFITLSFDNEDYTDGGDNIWLNDSKNETTHKVVYKYPLLVQGVQFVSLPKGAEILCVQEQNRKPCLWALVNPLAEKQDVRIITSSTGEVFNTKNLKYIGTYQLPDNGFVGHLFKYLD